MGEFVKKAIELNSYKNFTVKFEDDACDPKMAVSAYNLLKLENVKVFYVTCSGSVLALAPLVKQNGDLIITAYAGSAEIRKTGDETIRFIPDAESIGQPISEYIKKASIANKYAFLYEDQAYSHSLINVIRPVLGVNLVADETYKGDSVDFRTPLTKIKGSGATDIIFVPVSEKPAYAIYKQMHELGMNPNIIGDVNVCDYQKAPTEFNLSITCWKAGLSKEKESAFAAKYLSRYGVVSGAPFYDAATYDAMHILDNIVGSIGQIQIPAIKKKLLTGVTGPINSYSFDASGEITNVSDYLTMVRE
jgi:ABC-type branched-subunit amino acid transport system substrate-binding protein